MWVSASAATKDLFTTTIQPILDSYRPAGVSALGFKKVSLGTIPPKVRTVVVVVRGCCLLLCSESTSATNNTHESHTTHGFRSRSCCCTHHTHL